MNYVREYYKEIETGKTIACQEVTSLYKRMVREMDNPLDSSFPFWFSEESGQYVIDFIEGYCKHYQGDHAGEKDLPCFLATSKKYSLNRLLLVPFSSHPNKH